MITIYLIQNSINDKKYVGQTIKSLGIRFARHCWASEYKKNMPISSAIKKYGKEKFFIAQIDSASTLEEANAKEVFWANYYKCFSPYGYNLKAGGRKTCHMSEETKRKIAKANTGKKASEETKRKLSESHKGHVPSVETRQKLSDHFKGKPTHPNTKLGASLKNAKKYLFLNPQGEEVEINNMKRFCLEQHPELIPSGMCEAIKGRFSHHRGWVFIKLIK